MVRQTKSKAFWINAYNAYTLQLILRKLSIEEYHEDSTKTGKMLGIFRSLMLVEKHYTLNYIEHEILRKDFNDPRIHVGVNCASGSCPQLGKFAFTEA